MSNEWEEKGWVGMRPSWPIFQSSYSVAGRLITTIVPDPLPDQAHRLFGFLAYPATPDAPYLTLQTLVVAYTWIQQ